MSTQLNLKEIELRAFRSTYEDGLWDIYFGLIVICMSIFIYRPASGYSPTNTILAVLAMSVAYGLFWAAKKYITVPRMGQVEFGAKRQKRKLTLTIVLGVVVLVQVAFLAFQAAAWANPNLGAHLNEFLSERDVMDLAVASVGTLFVCPSMILIAYFIDFTRGYFIAIMFSLAVFLMIYLNQPFYPIIIGVLIALPGAVLLVRFLRKYPLRREEAAPHE
jgi:hypothetical protein